MHRYARAGRQLDKIVRFERFADFVLVNNADVVSNNQTLQEFSIA
jgi:hypothetical protein